jgi:small subunit ribosomal protein S21
MAMADTIPQSRRALHKTARAWYELANGTGCRDAARFFTSLSGHGRGALVQVLVRDNNVDQALRALKKKMQREGIFREMKLRRNYEKPSERRARERAEAIRRHRKLLRKRLDREGY